MPQAVATTKKITLLVHNKMLDVRKNPKIIRAAIIKKNVSLKIFAHFCFSISVHLLSYI